MLPVPMFHCAEVSTYPLNFVGVTAAAADAAAEASSARRSEGLVTRPAEISANVHWFNFIFVRLWFLEYLHNQEFALSREEAMIVP